MPDDNIRTADELIPEENGELYSAIERDARRYNKAFTEDEEGRG